MRVFAGGVFVATLTTVVSLWAVKGTEFRSGAWAITLYAVLGVSAVLWLTSSLGVEWQSPVRLRKSKRIHPTRPQLETDGAATLARRQARHVLTEIHTIDETIKAALASGHWWNVATMTLPALEWRDGRDPLADHAPRAYDAAAAVYVTADLLNKAAIDHAQGGEDDYGEPVRRLMERLCGEAQVAEQALREFAA